MNRELQKSYDYCARVAKTQARNFYYSFIVLPPNKRAAMCAIYAFMRYSDDISDEAALATDRRFLLPQWREALDRAFCGDYGDSKILPAFHDTVKRYNIPKKFFDELIDGVEMDLDKTRYATFDELYQYCYRVASVVGFVCIHVWGFRGGDTAYIPAEACGLAFQLTNILRDVREDAERGRIYLPPQDLDRYGVTEQELLDCKPSPAFRELMKYEVERAYGYYDQALRLIPMIEPDGRSTYRIMFRIYRELLDKIVEHDYDVFSDRARLSSFRKLRIVLGAWGKSRFEK